MTRGKRYAKAREGLNKEPKPLAEALAVVLDRATAKFDEAVELHIRLGVDPTKSDQMVRGTVSLPNGTGKTAVIAAFVPENMEEVAKKAGAEIVGGEKLIEEIGKTNKIGFAVAVAHPSMMPKLAKIAKILGPKGLLPNPKNETVGPDVAKLIEGLKGGKAAFRMDEQGNIHQIIGKVSFGAEKLAANAQAFIDAVNRVKPDATKGVYIKSKSVCSTMGPSVRVL